MDRLPEIEIKPIPNDRQRYPTVGDFWEDMGIWRFRVSQMGNRKMEFLVILHELVEWALTQDRGIKEPDIAAFDMLFEEERAAGKHSDEDEPGDDPRACYRREHAFATKIEKLMALQLGVNWSEYSAAVVALEWKGGA